MFSFNFGTNLNAAAKIVVDRVRYRSNRTSAQRQEVRSFYLFRGPYLCDDFNTVVVAVAE